VDLPTRRCILRSIAVAAALMLLLAPPALALDGPHNFRNANIADRAEQRANGTWAGQCLVFASDMIVEAGGPRFWFGDNTSTYQAQWAQRAASVGSLAEARRGDVIQWGGGAGGPGLHTAIVTAPGSNPSVIDSNVGWDERVHRGSFSSRNGSATPYRIWRVGRDDSPPPPPPTDAGKPFGNVDVLTGASGGHVQVQGWTIDPDERTASTDVHVYIDGPAGSPGVRGVNLGAADISRPDVAQVHGGSGERHGFGAAIPGVGPGNHSVYVYAINRAGGGGNPLIGSTTVNVPADAAGSPFGAYDELLERAGYKADVHGWTIDPDAPGAATEVHAYVDGPAGVGRGINLGDADVSRPDVDAVHHAGAAHGLDERLSDLAAGAHTVWLYAINRAGSGDNILLGAKRVWISGPSPIGHLDVLAGALPGSIALNGWTMDPDAPTSPTEVHVYIDGPAGSSGARGVNLGAADVLRPDVADVYAGGGPDHGFSTAIQGVPAGPHAVYVYAINRAGGGDNPMLGSTTVNIPEKPAGTPFGSFDTASGGAGLASITGWTVDPDAPTLPTDMHTYVDGPAGSGARGIDFGAADRARPDVGAANRGVGDSHGFEKTVGDLAPGRHVLWVYAINRAGDGGNPLLRTLPVTVGQPAAAAPQTGEGTVIPPSGQPSLDTSACATAERAKAKAWKKMSSAKRAYRKQRTAKRRRQYEKTRRAYSTAKKRATKLC
jgi:hypothetical protein